MQSVAHDLLLCQICFNRSSLFFLSLFQCYSRAYISLYRMYHTSTQEKQQQPASRIGNITTAGRDFSAYISLTVELTKSGGTRRQLSSLY